RRRHTRSKRDWSSDVCSSDLESPKKLLPYSPRARQIIAYATDEARRMQAPLVGTEHILLGLLRDDEIISSKILESLDISLQKARKLVLKRIGINDTASTRGTKYKRKSKMEKQQADGTPTMDTVARDLTE